MKVRYVVSAGLLVLAGTACAGPTVLSDTELADLTAGSYALSSDRASAIVSDASTVISHDTAQVSLQGQAQQNVTAVTLSNATQGHVANASNIVVTMPIGAGESGAVRQLNGVEQQDTAQASIGTLQLQGANVAKHTTLTSSSEFSGGIIPETFTFYGTKTSSTTKPDDNGNPKTTTSTSKFSESLKIGVGVALAGFVSLDAGGGKVSFSANDYGYIKGTYSTSSWWGLENSTTNTHTVWNAPIHGEVDIPSLKLQAEGIICVVVVGSCAPSHGINTSNFSEETLITNPARMDNASAEKIVMSGSVLNETRNHDVAMSDKAQQGARALNIVNSSAALSANTLNIAQRATAGAGLNGMGLQQLNQVTQYK